MRILIVEDEAPISELIRHVLEELGHACEVARSADEASEFLESMAVDAITLDLSMPGRPSLDWLEELARDRPDLARRTLVITGAELMAPEVARVALCGAGVLVKPFRLEGLQNAVRSHLAAPKSESPPVR